MTRRGFLSSTAMLTASTLLRAQQGAPAGSADAYATPKADLAGPFQPSWESLRDRYTVPSWFRQAKFGIFIHWGLYSLPAHGNEWYERHMYQNKEDSDWHTQHYGPADKFGYKDFIPLFTTPNYHPDEWAQLFVDAGAKYVVPVAEHHDGFAMYDSGLTPWCASKMGPKRDLIGELATAARKKNMIFGLSSHRMEHAYFAYPTPELPNDQNDPRYAGFYGPPIQGEFNSAGNGRAFQMDWLARTQELIDKYAPQMLYFDNGINPREYDEVKLRAAAYFYNRAAERKQESTLATKDYAYLFATVQDFEGSGRAPKWPYPAAWQCDSPIGNSWGYIDGLKVISGLSLIRTLVEIASNDGNLLLNISPKGDGSIPQDQQDSLRMLGTWLKTHGEAIYGSHAWHIPGEGPGIPATAPGDWKGGSTASPLPKVMPVKHELTEETFRFTVNRGSLYAIGMKYRAGTVTVKSLPASQAKVERVTLLRSAQGLKFRQTEAGTQVELPQTPTASEEPYVLRIEGKMNGF